MRFGLQARFIAILSLATMLCLVVAWVLHGQVGVHERAIDAVLHPSTAAASASAPAAVDAAIAQANHHYRLALSATIFVCVLLLAAVAWLVWQTLVRPVLKLAATARRIEAGEVVGPLADAQRDDEIGDVACAFDTLVTALAGLRERMHHDAARLAAEAAAPAAARASAPVAAVAAPPAPVVSAPAATAPAAAPAPAAIVAPAPPTAAQLARLAGLEEDLHDAWRRDELRVLYQPIHSLSDGRMRGAEALLRWQHPLEGAISPAEFIPLAERSDLIVDLGRHVLVQACSDASLWPGDGTPENSPFVSVNVAQRQLRHPQIFEYVVEALRKSGLEASRLHLEIPAAALREEDPIVESMIEQLRGLGLQIWIDASGVDAGDPQRWMKPSVSGVKVGHSRIRERGQSAADAASTDAIVATARSLRVVAVVVGVEQLSELNVLKEQGAELAQGYVLCKPVSTDEIGRRLLG